MKQERVQKTKSGTKSQSARRLIDRLTTDQRSPSGKTVYAN